jgi:cytochrome c oxidase subunit II
MRKALPVHLLRRSRRLLIAPLAFSALVLSGCAKDAPQDTFAPEGPVTRDIHRLAKPVFAISVAVGIFVYALLAICVVKFRRKGEDHVPKQVHGNTAAELTWTAIPAAILICVGFFSVGAIFKQAEEPADAYNISVIGHQWWWEYHYPQVGESKLAPVLKTIDDPVDAILAKEEGRAPKKIANVLTETTPVIVGANELHIPAGRNVRLLISSRDVMHNYWVPKLAGKIYAIPGKINRLTINSDPEDAGKTIYGQCAEFCGTSHANMRFKVVIDSPADFEKWLRGQAGAATEPTTELAKAGKELFSGAGCTACHWLDPSRTNGYEMVKDADGVESATVNIGPNLAHIGSRKTFAGAIAPLDERDLRAWLRNPQTFKPGSRMVIRKLSEDEITKLVAYIQSLK